MPDMKVHIVSDLHLTRTDTFKLPKTDAKLVIIPGDISAMPRVVRSFLKGISDETTVAVVPGNHEFYYSDYTSRLRELTSLLSERNVKFLENNECFSGNVRILGATLWSDFNIFGEGDLWDQKTPSDVRGFSDFVNIELQDECLPTSFPGAFSPRTARELYRRSIHWLTERLEEKHDGPTIVVTHHAPSLLSVAKEYKNHYLTPAFASNLDDLIRYYQPALWIHGHVHHCLNYALANTRVICNPRGTSRDYLNGFDPALTIEI